VLGVANSFAGLDIASGIAGLITEAAYRLNWFPKKTYYFVVKDWEPCTGEWGGTITSSLNLKQTRTERLNSGYESDYEHTYTFNADITVGAGSKGTIDATETSFNDQRSAPNIRTTSRPRAEPATRATLTSVLTTTALDTGQIPGSQNGRANKDHDRSHLSTAP
jgi:hypothetical protein